MDKIISVVLKNKPMQVIEVPVFSTLLSIKEDKNILSIWFAGDDKFVMGKWRIFILIKGSVIPKGMKYLGTPPEGHYHIYGTELFNGEGKGYDAEYTEEKLVEMSPVKKIKVNFNKINITKSKFENMEDE